MEVSTKELRVQPGKIIDQVVHGEEVTVTFRGKALARIVPIRKADSAQSDDGNGIFGMWADVIDQDSVDSTVRNIRKGRQF